MSDKGDTKATTLVTATPRSRGVRQTSPDLFAGQYYFPYPFSGVHFMYRVDNDGKPTPGTSMIPLLDGQGNVQQKLIVFEAKTLRLFVESQLRQLKADNSANTVYVYPALPDEDAVLKTSLQSLVSLIKAWQVLVHTVAPDEEGYTLQQTAIGNVKTDLGDDTYFNQLSRMFPGNPHRFYRWLWTRRPIDFFYFEVDGNAPVYIMDRFYRSSRNWLPLTANDGKDVLVFHVFSNVIPSRRAAENVYCGDIQSAWEISALNGNAGNFDRCGLLFVRQVRQTFPTRDEQKYYQDVKNQKVATEEWEPLTDAMFIQYQQQQNELNQNIESLRALLSERQVQIELQRKTLLDIQSQVQSTNVSNAELQRELQQLRSRIDSAAAGSSLLSVDPQENKQIADLKNQMETLNATLTANTTRRVSELKDAEDALTRQITLNKQTIDKAKKTLSEVVEQAQISSLTRIVPGKRSVDTILSKEEKEAESQRSKRPRLIAAGQELPPPQPQVREQKGKEPTMSYTVVGGRRGQRGAFGPDVFEEPETTTESSARLPQQQLQQAPEQPVAMDTSDKLFII